VEQPPRVPRVLRSYWSPTQFQYSGAKQGVSASTVYAIGTVSHLKHDPVRCSTSVYLGRRYPALTTSTRNSLWSSLDSSGGDLGSGGPPARAVTPINVESEKEFLECSGVLDQPRRSVRAQRLNTHISPHLPPHPSHPVQSQSTRGAVSGGPSFRVLSL
jgi:hypothetical protein